MQRGFSTTHDDTVQPCESNAYNSDIKTESEEVINLSTEIQEQSIENARSESVGQEVMAFHPDVKFEAEFNHSTTIQEQLIEIVCSESIGQESFYPDVKSGEEFNDSNPILEDTNRRVSSADSAIGSLTDDVDFKLDHANDKEANIEGKSKKTIGNKRGKAKKNFKKGLDARGYSTISVAAAKPQKNRFGKTVTKTPQA